MVIDLIGVPLSYGSGKVGAELGPDSLRKEGILNLAKDRKFTLYDLGNIFDPSLDDSDMYTSNKHLKFLDPIVDINKNLAELMFLSLKSNHFPITIGGDHSLAIGSIAGCSKFYDNLDNFGVIWIDAHGDINTEETSPSGNIHGMPLAASLNEGNEKLTNVYFKGRKVKPENVYIIGTRDVDEGEYKLAEKLNLSHYEMKDIRSLGFEKTLEKIIGDLKISGVENFHLSFDIDALDPSVTPATGTPVKGGFTLEEGKKILSSFIETGLIKSLDFVELNPKLYKPELTIKNCLSLLDTIFTSIDKTF